MPTAPAAEPLHAARDITASRCWFHTSAQTRIVLHLDGDAHFVLLEFEHVTSVHISNREGMIEGDWYGCVVEPRFEEAIRVFASTYDLSPVTLSDLVAPYRVVGEVLHNDARAMPARGTIAPTESVIHMGDSSLPFEPPDVAKGKVVSVKPCLACARQAEATRPPSGESPSSQRPSDASRKSSF